MASICIRELLPFFASEVEVEVEEKVRFISSEEGRTLNVQAVLVQ
jgi:hypothetical protein